MTTRNHPTVFICLLFLALPLLATSGPTSDPTTGPLSVFDQLHRERVVRLTLELDIEKLMADRNTVNTQMATLSDGFQDYAVELQVRGRYRRRICDFPPLKLKFNKDWLRTGGLSMHNDIKLVTHCLADESGRENILRELLAYELYAMLTNQSLRTQLVEITYVDRKTQASETHLGILIEDVDELAERLGGEECDECYSASYTEFQANNPEVVTMFQYMIGNTDWDTKMQRNVKNIRLQNGQSVLVPYDFDFSGLVAAGYARANPDLGQTEIGQRFWQWGFTTSPNLAAAKNVFLSKKIELLQYVENYELLSKRSRREVSKYLMEFYEILESNDFPATI